MFAKTLALALVLTGASLSFIGNVSAAPARGGWQATQNYMYDRSAPSYIDRNDGSVGKDH